jgi:hypothetical protein
VHLLLGRHLLQPLLVALLQLVCRDLAGDLALDPEILQHLVLDEGHALLEGWILRDLALLALLDDQLAVDDAVEQRGEHRLQGHVAILLRQRLLGDLKLRQPDRLAIDRGNHGILECRLGSLGRRLGGRSRRLWLTLGLGLALRIGGLLGRRGSRDGSRCATQDEQAQGTQAMAHDLLRNLMCIRLHRPASDPQALHPRQVP